MRSTPHDDYDNGHALCEEKEGQCRYCCVLVLVCHDFLQQVRCWGEDPELLSRDDTEKDKQPQGNDDICKMNLFRGRGGRECMDER